MRDSFEQFNNDLDNVRLIERAVCRARYAIAAFADAANPDVAKFAATAFRRIGQELFAAANHIEAKLGAVSERKSETF